MQSVPNITLEENINKKPDLQKAKDKLISLVSFFISQFITYNFTV